MTQKSQQQRQAWEKNNEVLKRQTSERKTQEKQARENKQEKSGQQTSERQTNEKQTTSLQLGLLFKERLLFKENALLDKPGEV